MATHTHMYTPYFAMVTHSNTHTRTKKVPHSSHPWEPTHTDIQRTLRWSPMATLPSSGSFAVFQPALRAAVWQCPLILQVPCVRKVRAQSRWRAHQSVLQCVSVCGSASECVVVYLNVLQCVSMCCSLSHVWERHECAHVCGHTRENTGGTRERDAKWEWYVLEKAIQSESNHAHDAEQNTYLSRCRTQHLSNKTPIEQNTYLTKNLSNKTPIEQNLYRTKHLSNKTPIEQNTYRTKHLSNKTPIEQNAYRTKHLSKKTPI